MLTKIEDYLLERLTPQRTQIFMDALKLIHSYEVVSPIESIVEVTGLQETYSNEESMVLIETIVSNALQEILANQYVITTGNLQQQLELLKGLNLLEHYIDSDVIVSLNDEDLTPQEMLLKFLNAVTTKPIEYFDVFILDVRPHIISLLISKHTNEVEADVVNQESGIEASKLEVVKLFAEKHPDALAIKAVTRGIIRLDMDIILLLNILRQDIYKLTVPAKIAEAIYSLVLVSNTEHIEVPKMTMTVVNELYDELELIGELKYLVTSFD
jgi:hypothetical protein